MWGHIKGRETGGFALPTVLIASLVMLIVLASTLSSVVAVTVAGLDARHYSYYAKTAAQSGLAMAQACLKANNYEATWTNANPLRPHTNCSGVVQSGVSQYLHNETLTKSTFSIPAPTNVSNGVQRISVVGRIERMNVNTSAVWRTYTDSSYAVISAQSTFSTVTFGYVNGVGAYFGVVDSLGKVSTVGYNGNGQLGNGTTSNTTTPVTFAIPTGTVATQLYSNILSEGRSFFAKLSDGRIYGAGANSYGELGNGNTTSPRSTPVQFNLPAGVTASYVSPGSYVTYVIGSDNNVYSAGNCANGRLGYTYTISGCTSQSSYRRVALPTVNVSDTNTLPVANSDWIQPTNIVTDTATGYVRMQGGRVYGWGLNDKGQLGNSSQTDTATPVQITTLGNSGQPTARQLAYDGTALWILDSTGQVWSVGSNAYGQLGTSSPMITGSGKCMDIIGNATANGSRVGIYDCAGTHNPQLFEWAQNGTIRVWPNGTTLKCITNAGGASANGNQIQINDCTGSASQLWTMNNNGAIVNPSTNKCIDNPSNATTNGTFLQLYDCLGNASQNFTLGNRLVPRQMVLPSGQGTVARITTDQHSLVMLMTNGTVWGYGLNTSGQLGNGSLNLFNPAIKQYTLPAGRTAIDIYTTKSGTDTSTNYANTYAILDNGSVVGAGSNAYGQLGNGATAATVSTPTLMSLPAGVRAQTVQSGLGTTIILTDEGKVYTVGNNANGQLGDGTTTNSSTPLARRYVNTRPVVLY